MNDDDARDAINQARQDARQLIQARRLPVDQPLTEQQCDAVRDDVNAYRKRYSVKIEEIAKQAEISPSVVSQFLSGKYKGDVERVARVLNDWQEAHARRRVAGVSDDYVRTEVAESMRAIISEACALVRMAAIVTPSGSGKTLVLEAMREKTRGVYIYCDEDLTATAFLRELAELVTRPRDRGKKSRPQSKRELSKLIVNAMRGSNRPIFLDEAHRLPREVLSRIRTIHDRAGVPIIMAGASEILDRINDRSDGHGQFASRCLQYNVLEHCLNAEGPDGTKAGRPLYSKAEVAAYFAQLEVKLTGDAFEMAWAIACLPNHGCFRTLKELVRRIRRTPASRSKPIERAEIRKALMLQFGQTGAMIANLATRHIERTKAA